LPVTHLSREKKKKKGETHPLPRRRGEKKRGKEALPSPSQGHIIPFGRKEKGREKKANKKEEKGTVEHLTAKSAALRHVSKKKSNQEEEGGKTEP